MSLKHSSNEILNSWKKEKLSSSMKLNQQHCILIWKLTSEIRSFFSVWSLRQSYPHWLYFTIFRFALNGKISLRFKRSCLYIKVPTLYIFATQLQWCVYSWVHSAKSFRCSFKVISEHETTALREKYPNTD